MYERYALRKELMRQGKTLPPPLDPLEERRKDLAKHLHKWNYRDHERPNEPGKYFRFKEENHPRGTLYFPAPVSMRWFHIRERREDRNHEDFSDYTK